MDLTEVFLDHTHIVYTHRYHTESHSDEIQSLKVAYHTMCKYRHDLTAVICPDLYVKVEWLTNMHMMMALPYFCDVHLLDGLNLGRFQWVHTVQ